MMDCPSGSDLDPACARSTAIGSVRAYTLADIDTGCPSPSEFAICRSEIEGTSVSREAGRAAALCTQVRCRFSPQFRWRHRPRCRGNERCSRSSCEDYPSVGAKNDVVDVKVSAIDQRKASCGLLVPRNAEGRSERWIDSPGYVGLELRFVQRP
jgi:hypothetical protein